MLLASAAAVKKLMRLKFFGSTEILPLHNALYGDGVALEKRKPKKFENGIQYDPNILNAVRQQCGGSLLVRDVCPRGINQLQCSWH